MSTKLLKTLTATAVVFALFGCGSSHKHHKTPAPNPKDPFVLNVIHMNDLHSQFDGVEGNFVMGKDSVNKQKFYTTFGGYPRVLQQVNDDIAASDKSQTASLVLNAGDAFQGSIYFQTFNGEANANLLKNMKIDAMAVGNHEFDLGTPALKMLATTVNFPMLADNMDASKNVDLKDVSSIKPYQLFAYKGTSKRKIDNVSDAKSGEVVVAVIGVALENMGDFVSDSKFAGVTFSSEIESTQKEIDTLKTLGVDKVVVVSHIGLAADKKLAQGTTGIDLIVGGHSHTLLGDFTNIGLTNNGEYAEMLSQKTGDAKTCIVQAGSNAQAVGEVQVQFNKDGNVETCQGHNTLLSADEFYSDEAQQTKVSDETKAEIENYISGLENQDLKIVTENPDLRSQIDTDYKNSQQYQDAIGAQIGVSAHTIYQVRRPGDLSGVGNYQEPIDKTVSECSATGSKLRCYHGSQVAPLVGQAFLDWLNSDRVQDVLDAANGRHVDVALVAAGGVRTNIKPGAFYEGNIRLEMLPFKNHLTVMTITGAELKSVLMSTIAPVLDATAHAGKFPYVAGMRYTFVQSASDKATGTFSQMQLKQTNEDGTVTWQDINDADSYTVAVGNYNANGNDGWSELAKAEAKENGAATNRQDVYFNVDPDTSVRTPVVNSVTMTTTEKDGKTTYTPVGEPECSGNTICDSDAESFINFSKALGNTELVPSTEKNTTLVFQPK
ncbi:bifunctional metallophosphatase/5'-nucleotidase [Shewanella sp. OPT22]|nr:bifunctional metallophosphatase/5'-nucleotidase [Shewanella sp. OPT22]